MQGWGLFPVIKICVHCQQIMRLEKNNVCKDKYLWRCGLPCRKTEGMRKGTFFQPWKARLGDIICAMHLWSSNNTATIIQTESGLSRKVTLSLCQKLRLCCTNHLARNPINIGGMAANYVVQIDESMFHHRQRNNRERMAQNPVWVFGMVDTQFTPAKGYMEIVPNRTRQTLTRIMNAKLNANSVVHSDQWRAYMRLPQFVPACIRHDTVNHTFNFVDPNTGVHTQHVESYWNSTKNES